MTTPTGSPAFVVHMKTHSFCLSNSSCSRCGSIGIWLMSTENSPSELIAVPFLITRLEMHATACLYDLSSHPPAIVGRQEDDNSGDVVRLAEPPERRLLGIEIR